MSDAEIAELYNNGTGLELQGASSVNLTTGLQAFYKLSDLTDSSGNNRTHTNNGNVSFASGKLGNAANLQGSQTLEAQINSISSSSSGSYSCWVNRNGIVEFPLCLIKAFGTSVYADSYTATHPDGRLNGSIPSLGEFSVNLNSTDWAHFVLSYNSTTQEAKMYANGQVFYAGTTSSAFQDSNFVIGAGDGWQGKGLVDAVGIWDRALTEAEVAELYNGGDGLELGSEGNNYNSYFSVAKIQGKSIFTGKVKFIDPMGYNS